MRLFAISLSMLCLLPLFGEGDLTPLPADTPIEVGDIKEKQSLKEQPPSEGEVEKMKRINAFLLLNDPASALVEVKEGLIGYPQSKSLHQAHIEVLAKVQDEKGMLKAWQTLLEKFPEEKENRILLESMAWGTFEKALNSSAPPMRLIASLAAFFANDAKSVQILLSNMRDSNALVRAMTVQLASGMRDVALSEEVMRLFKNETVFAVRLELVKAIGKMGITSARNSLESIIGNPKSTAEEKSAAIQSIVALLETAEREEIIKLSQSDRAGLRVLACEVVSHFDLYEAIDVIMPLLSDHHAEVRAAALRVLGYLHVKEFQGRPISDYVACLQQDHDFHVAVTAVWVLMLNESPDGQLQLKKWLNHERSDVRLFAAGALSSTGRLGLPLMVDAFHLTQDPYVRINLAMGLLSQRIETEKACAVLAEGLRTMKENWMWNEEGSFSALGPSTLKNSDMSPQNPRTADQLIRLEILSLLAMMKYPYVQETLKQFLQENSWGITWTAATLLLTEGDENALALVRNLLTDSQSTVRIQAAILLSLWGGDDDEAIAVLQQAYKGADRECKAHILEGLGNIRATSTIPFLITVLQEPHQTLRLIAACAILQCLNH